MKHMIAVQRCNHCNQAFLVRYNSDGTYDYLDDYCSCESEFHPDNGYPSISEWLEQIRKS